LTTFADKVAVRDYVLRRVGPEILTEAYAVVGDADALGKVGLPRQFVAKASHASGGVVIVGDHVPREHRLPPAPANWTWFEVNPASLELERPVDRYRDWLGRSFDRSGEWAYIRVKPRILVEELLVVDESSPVDYKLFVFSGTVRLVQIDHDRFGEHRRNLYGR